MALKGVNAVKVTTGLASVYTVPAGFQTRYISLIFCNSHSTVVSMTVHHIPTGGSATDPDNLLIEHNTDTQLVAGETREEGYSRVRHAGDSSEVKASVTNKVILHFSCEEVAV